MRCYLWAIVSSLTLTVGAVHAGCADEPRKASDKTPGRQALAKQPGTGEATVKKTVQKPAGRWGLLIAVDNYAEAAKLEYCGADMVALRDQLVAADFPEKQVFLLHDKADDTKYRPLKANIERQLDLVLRLVERDDLLVVAFSGHGVHREGKSYLCPAETRLDDPKTMVPLNEVYKRLENCQAALKLLLVDACRNDPRPGGQRSLTPTEGTRQFAASLDRPPEGILLLASCAPGQISMEEKEFGHGVFMHFLLEGLQGKADPDGKGRVSLMDLYKYVNRETKAYVARKFNGYQTPALKGDLTSDYEIATCAPKSRIAAVLERGKKYWQDKKHDWAIAEFNEAVRLNPKNGEAYCYRGLAYVGKGEKQIAMADFDDAIRVDPKYIFAYQTRAGRYRELREFDKSRADYEAIIAIYNGQIRFGTPSV